MLTRLVELWLELPAERKLLKLDDDDEGGREDLWRLKKVREEVAMEMKLSMEGEADQETENVRSDGEE